MKIVFDNIVFSLQKSGGISVVWKELLSRFVAEGKDELCFIEHPTDLNNQFRRGIELKGRVITKSSQLFAIERYINPRISKGEPFIFHSSYFRTCASKNAVNITTVHDFTYDYFYKGKRRGAFLHLWQRNRAIRNADAVVCISENTKQDVLRAYPWLDEDKIHVVYNGVSDIFHPMPSVQKQGYLLYMGNSKATYKRYDVAQEVARLTGLPLVTASGVTAEQLNRYYNEALCLIYPSDYEGFGLPILEAQKAGCPVIAQRASSIPEVIGDGGWLVAHDTPQRMAAEMADVVRQIQSQPVQDVVKKGMENAKRFSWNNTYQQTKQVYKRLMQ